MQTLYCPACKAVTQPNDRFCKRCGTAQHLPTQPKVERENPAPPGAPSVAPPLAGAVPVVSLRCPACDSETVQKISGLFQAGAWSSVTQGTFGGVMAAGNGHLTPFGGGTVTQQQGATGLARLLAPPPAPPSVTPLAVRCILYLIFVMLLFAGFCYFVGSINPAWQTMPYAWVFLWMPYLCGLGVLALAYPAWRATQGQRVEQETAMEQWRVRMGNWNALYYCGRCDRAFHPATRRSAPALEMASLL